MRFPRFLRASLFGGIFAGPFRICAVPRICAVRGAAAFAFACVLACCAPAFAGTATTTTLAVISGGSAVTSVSSGTVVTLTATVTAGSTPVTTGQVNFCDTTATYCKDIHIVGTAQLTSTGTAVFRFRPGIGSHSYKAVFVGTDTYTTSNSSASSLAVTGLYPTTTTFGVSGNSGTYRMVFVVIGFGGPAQCPSGSVSFLDTSNGNAVVGTAALGSGTPAPFIPSPSGLPVSNNADPVAIAVGDLNGDGIPDVAIVNIGLNTVTILLGNGDGTFTPAASPATGYEPDGIVIGDFNGDGIPDLAVANYDNDLNGSGGSVTVLLGNGDGTFSATASSPATGYEPDALVTGDFNGDGILDLAVANEGSNTVTVLLGNGDGTFTAASASPATGSLPDAIAMADFNGNGIEDLAVANQQGTVTVLLGKGDGTFTTAPNLPNSGEYYFSSIVTADFNGDGIPDIAVSGPDYSSVMVLLGKGDGTFTAGPGPNGTGNAIAMAVGDFNGDGIPDLAAIGSFPDGTNAGIGPVIYIGNGDGTFSATASDTNSISYSGSIALGDFNGNGTPGVAWTNPGAAFAAPVQWSCDMTGEASASLSLGTHSIEASYPGDANYSSSVSAPTNVYNTVATSLALSFAPANPVLGQPATLTATLSPYSDAGYSTNGETITFLQATSCNDGCTYTTLGTGTLSGGVATLTLPPLNAGGFTLRAAYGGDANFAASSGPAFFDVAPAQPVLTLSANPLNSAQGQSVTLTATLAGYDAVSGVTGEVITFSSNTQTIGTATLNSSGVATLTTTALPLGLNSLLASYPGDSNDATATANLQVLVRGANQAASSVALAVTSSGAPVTTAASGTPVVLTASVAAGGAPVTRGTVTFCDEANPQPCGVVAALGTAQLTSGGTASITVRPAIGVRSLSAFFAGTTGDGAAVSAASSLTVTGLYATRASFTPQTISDTVSFTGTIVATAPASAPSPTGTMQFIDQSVSNTVLATQPVNVSTSYLAARFLAVGPNPATGAKPFSIAIADFNHDGIPDLAVASSTGNSVGVLLGKGDSTFQSQVSYAAGNGAFAVTVGDFNGDGNTDLAVTDFSANTVSVLLGNGDGTFKTQVSYATGGGPAAIATGDFNGDGVLDLAVTNETDNTVSILLGNSDGTFQAQQTYATGDSPDAIAVADFNGDGFPDLAVANNAGATVSILLGKGDGTFQTQVPYAVGNGPVSIAVADFNGDAHADLAVANISDNTLSVLLGNGDGTFQTQSTYSTGTSPEAVTAGSLSGLGYTDLAVASSSGSVVVFENNGSGAFTAPTSVAVSGSPISIVAADWNGDGMTGLAVLSNSTAEVTVLQNNSGPRSLTSASSPIVLSGTHTVVATYSGDTNYRTGMSGAWTLQLALYQPGVVLVLNATNPSNYGNAITMTATLSPYAVGDINSNGDSIQFKSGSTLLGTETLASGVAVLSTTALPVGVDSIQAVYSGDTFLSPSNSAVLSQTVRPATLTVTGPDVSRAYGSPNPALTGTATGAVNGDTFTVTGTTTATPTSPLGSYPVVPTATGADLSNYSVVTVNGTLTVTQATPQITLVSSASPAFVTNAVTFTAQLNSQGGTPTGSVSFYDQTTLLGTVPMSSGAAAYTTSALAAGSHSITAAYSGDTNFAAVTSSALAQTIENFTIGTGSGGTTSVTASPGGQAVYTFTVSPPSGATLAGPISFSVTGLPTGATATFSPTTITAGAGATTETMTVTLPASAAALPPSSGPHRSFGGALPMALGLILLQFAMRLRKGSRSLERLFRVLVLTVAGAALAAGLSGCGGGGGSSTGNHQPPPQSYTLTITASSGSLSNTITVNLTVE
jgi:hypothetical protein